MSDPSSTPSLAELLTHADWVRALARELVRDPDRADDVVQQTWLAALRRPPRTGTNVRGWLAAVVRNVVRGGARSERRRDFHEQRGARPGASAPDHELMERARLSHELSEHVLALEDPYRTVLLLRYFEGLPPRAIAARMGVPVATVRTREARALERLRERLTRARGSAEEWMRELSALVAGLPAAVGAGALVTGGLWMGMQAKLWTAAAGIALSLAAVWWFTREQSVELAASTPAERKPAELEESPIAQPGPTSERSAAALPAVDPTASPSTPPPTYFTRGVVLDTHGRAVSGVMVVQVPAEGNFSEQGLLQEIVQRSLEARESEPRLPSAVSVRDESRTHVATDSLGRFKLVEQDLRPMRYVVRQEGWVVVAEGRRIDDSGSTELVLVVERTVSLVGEVVDSTGAPIANAQVQPKCSLQAMTTFPFTLQDVREGESLESQSSDAAGRVPLTGVPRVEGLRLRAWTQGFQDALSPPLSQDTSGIVRIVMHRSSVDAGLEIEGRVVDARGQGLSQAMVSFAEFLEQTDEQGAFRIRIDAGHRLLRSTRDRAAPERLRNDLIAVYPGLQPAILADLGASLDDPGSRTGLVLRLDKPALSILGTVTDDAGRPRPGVEIVLADPTPMGRTSLEVEIQTRQKEPAWIGDGRIFTDEGGRFEVAGLSARDYHIVVCDHERCVVMQSDPIPAGTRDLVLREPASAWFENVRGQVESRGGRPLRGVDVFVTLRLIRSSGLVFARDVRTTKTDSEGRFYFDRIPRDTASIAVSGGGVEPIDVSVTEYIPGRAWRITVPVQARFRIEATSGESAQRFSVLDADGRELPMVLLRADGARLMYDRAPLSGAATAVFTTGDTATTLVLYHGDEELRRVPIQLSVDELTVLRL